MRYNNTEYFYVFNVLGDITYLLDTNGDIVVEYSYDSYGNITYQTSSTIAEANPYRYRGYRYDEETGYYYLQSRYYNPETGRFINADGMLAASSTILGNNMFAYTENNPVMYVDPTGEIGLLVILGIAAGLLAILPTIANIWAINEKNNYASVILPENPDMNNTVIA